MKTEDRGLRIEDGGESRRTCAAPSAAEAGVRLAEMGVLEWWRDGIGGFGEVICFAGVRAAPFQSARGLAQSKTWRRFGRAGFGSNDTGFWQFWGGQWEVEGKWLVTGRQELGTGRGREIRINPHLTAFVRVFFLGG